MKLPSLAMVMLALTVSPTLAQITVLDEAQDAAAQAGDVAAPAPPPPPPPCGTQPLTIARMSWPSAALLAEIHALLLTEHFGCTVRITPGDLAATASSMGSNGQPAVAPELWVNRVADLWNAANDAQMVRSAAQSYQTDKFEGWYMPAYLADGLGGAPSAEALAVGLAPMGQGGPIRFISCPIDWACSVINRNLVTALGLGGLVEIIEPANRFEMDRLIAEAINRREPFLFYYWQPNAILAQLDFAAIDMGSFDEDAAKCLASRSCNDPQPSAFASEQVVIALAERVFTDMPAIAGYFQRASLPIAEMDRMLAALNASEATPESVAADFVAERSDVWRAWIGEDR